MVSITCTRTWVGIDEVGLHENLFRGQSPFYELVARELGERYVGCNLAFPGAAQTVRRKHQSDNSGRGTRFVITGVLHAMQERTAYTFLTNFSIAKQRGCGTKQAVVVQCLHYRHFLFVTGRVNGGGDHHEGVVNVDHVRFLLAQQLQKVRAAIGSPYGPFGQTNLVETLVGLNFPIASPIEDYLGSAIAQHPSLLLKHDVFTSRLLIGVMNKKYLH